MREAIDSALAQTYDNIEVLVINDGSKDNGETERIALSYGNKIRYFAKKNGGVASALNMGIFEMKGDYFSWLSHDDLYLPEKVEIQVNHLATLSDKDTVVFSDYINVDEGNKDLYPVCMDHDLLNDKPMYAVFRGALHGCTLLIPRSAFIRVGTFNDLPTTQDYDLWFRMIRKFPFRHLPKILVRSRLHPNQGSRQLDATAEANELWIRMMRSLTPLEISSLEKSQAVFFEEMAKYLATSPYTEALLYAREKVSASVVVHDKIYTENLKADSFRKFYRRTRSGIKNRAKTLLMTIGMLDYIKTIRHRTARHDDKKSDLDNKRLEAVFVKTNKILLKLASGN